MPKEKDTHELIALWGEYLMHRHGLRRAGAILGCRITYSASAAGPDAVYEASGGNELLQAFQKNIEENMEVIESELLLRGILVRRPEL